MVGAALIHTIGHSTLPLDEFIGLLREHDIHTLADVRSLPGSRRYPHFNQERLAESMAEAGVDYVHIPLLGGHRRATANGGFETVRNSGMRGYAQYTDHPEFHEGLELLKGLDRPAAMCAEAVWWRCHRRIVAEALVREGTEVRHIMPNGSLVSPDLCLLAGDPA